MLVIQRQNPPFKLHFMVILKMLLFMTGPKIFCWWSDKHYTHTSGFSPEIFEGMVAFSGVVKLGSITNGVWRITKIPKFHRNTPMFCCWAQISDKSMIDLSFFVILDTICVYIENKWLVLNMTEKQTCRGGSL